MEERDILCYCRFVEEVTGGKIVHRVHDAIGTAGKTEDIRFVDCGIDDLHPDIRVDLAKFLSCRRGLLLPDVPVIVQDLAVEIGLVHDIHIGKSDRPDACNREVDGYGTAQSPGASDKYF